MTQDIYRGHRLPRQYLTEEELDRLLSVAKCEDLRDFAIIDVSYECFLRVSEVLNLRVGDVLPDGRIICRRLKGSKTNVLPIRNQDAWALIMAAVERRKDRAALLFDNVSRRTLDWRLKRYAHLARIPEEKAHMHALKHSACQHELDATGNVLATQKLAGHAYIGSTMEYCDMTIDQALSIHDEADRDRVNGAGMSVS